MFFSLVSFPKANLKVGVRYGHSAEIGSRRVMEDRTTAVRDLFDLHECFSSNRGRSDTDQGGSPVTAGNSEEGSQGGGDDGGVCCNDVIKDDARIGRTPGSHEEPETGGNSPEPVDDDRGGAKTGETRRGGGGGGGGSNSNKDNVVDDGDHGSTRGDHHEGRGGAHEDGSSTLTAAFFAVYDGHDGDVVAEALHQDLHKLVAKQVQVVAFCCFPYIFRQV